MSGFGENGRVPDTTTEPFRFRRVARRRFPIRTAIAAAVVLLVAGTAVLVLPGLLRHRGDDRAVELLDRIVPADETIPPGLYRVVTQRGWHLHRTDHGDHLVESEIAVWQPADPSAEWFRESHQTGAVRVLTGEPPEPAPTPVDVTTGTCGVFLGEDHDGCATTGTWYAPTPDFLAGLPDDPEALLSALRAAHAGQGDGVLVGVVADLLVGIPVPADLRMALCRALLLIEGNDVTEGAVDLTGRPAIVLGGPHPNGHREEILLDPVDGALLGRRQTATSDTPVPVGTVVSDIAVTTALVERTNELAVG